ncbi:MAG TPA: hypothetical protein VMW69_09635, partial [Spirochaetia bacterium]|nr:hypothetical protein [Spirochaetia bacterium]
MILDREPPRLSAEDRARLRGRLRPFEDVLATGSAELEVRFLEAGADIAKSRPASTFEFAALQVLAREKDTAPAEIGKALGFDEPDGDFGLRVCERLKGAGAISGDQSIVYLTEAGRQMAETGTVPERFNTNFIVGAPGVRTEDGRPIPVTTVLAKSLEKKIAWSDAAVETPPEIEEILAQCAERHPDLHRPDRGVAIIAETLVVRKRGTAILELNLALVRSRLDGLHRLVPINKMDRQSFAFSEALTSRADGVIERMLEGLAQFETSTDATESVPIEDDRDRLATLARQAVEGGNQAMAEHFKSMLPTVRPRRFGTLEFEDELLSLMASSRSIWIKSPFVRSRALAFRKGALSNLVQRKGVVVLIASL